MGVHTTFVRSLDLDEWTQRQLDAMRLGGNANARQYFRSHGLTDMHVQIEKKYTSKAAKQYKAELAKQVDAAAAQRGEGNGDDAVTDAGNLLENLALQQKQEQMGTQQLKTIQKTAAVAQPKAKLASQMSGTKGKLVVTPPNSGGLPTLRKPANKPSSSTTMFKKKPTGAKKLGVNKLVTSRDTSSDAAFDSLDDHAPAPAPAPVSAPAPVVVAAPPPTPPPKEPEMLKSNMETGVNRLKAMNSDFFSGM
jgi:ADP-ribosylation factor GTPase-activating protein 2/3